MSGGQQRTVLLIFHLVTSAFTGFYLYSPFGGAEPLHLAMQVLVFPAMMLTGVAMWQQARLRKLVRGRQATRRAMEARG